VTMFLDSQAL